MAADNKTKEAIELLAQHETAIGDLYREYSKKFPEETLWQTLAKEEDMHAKWILAFFSSVYDGKVNLNDRYNRESIWQSIKRVKELAKDAEKHSLNEALTYALAIEDMIVEKDYVGIFDETDPAVQEVLVKLIQSTQTHRNWIQARVDEIVKAS